MPYQRNPWEDILSNLAGRPDAPYREGETVPEPERTQRREDAYNNLKRLTGQDFGYDEAAWRNWMTSNPNWEEGIEARIGVTSKNIA